MSFDGDQMISRDTIADWITNSGAVPGDRLPPERKLSEQLSLSRGEVRKALTALEAEGVVERHVGRGTFLAEPAAGAQRIVAAVRHLSDITSPHHAMMARLSLEPEIAGHAAIHAAPRQLADARRLCDEMRAAPDWATYEKIDSEFHQLIADAADNPVLAELNRIVNAVRVSVVWSRLDVPEDGPPAGYHSFDEHDAIVTALERRDRAAAYATMRAHLKSVRATLMKDD